MPKAVKSQAIADLLTQFAGEEEFPLDDEDLGEAAMAEEVREQWVIKFDGFSTTQLGGVGVVLYHEEDKVVVLSFKLDFPYSNNTAEYEAYLTMLATALEMGIKHLKVMSDSNLVACQTKGSFSLKEPSLAPYRTVAQKMEENRYTDALVTLGSQIIFEGKSTKIEVSKKKNLLLRCWGKGSKRNNVMEIVSFP